MSAIPDNTDDFDVVPTGTVWEPGWFAKLLADAKDAHTRWEAVNGPDPDWPAWYGRYMLSRMIVAGVVKLEPREVHDEGPVPDPTEHEGPASVGGGFFFRGDTY